jgi:hypothetical protein
MTIFKGVTLFHHPGFTLGTTSGLVRRHHGSSPQDAHGRCAHRLRSFLLGLKSFVPLASDLGRWNRAKRFLKRQSQREKIAIPAWHCVELQTDR